MITNRVVAFIKDYVLIFALIFSGFSAMSFNLSQENLHWYQRQVDGTYTYDGLQPEPSSECDGESDDICAKGFTEENQPSNPTDVNDNTSSDDERFYD